MIIPPFAGVTLVEYRDRIELTPFEWVREIVGLGRFKADEVGPQPGDDMDPFFKAVVGDKEIWVIVRWHRFEDGREDVLNANYLDPETTEAVARREFESMIDFVNLSKAELEAIGKCFRASEDDIAYIENRFPGISRGPPESKSIDGRDLYQARMKVLAGMQPKTVELIHRAESTEGPAEREKIEREAVQAYFAELAHYWTEDLVKEWQQKNPIGTEWLCEFGRVFQEPERRLDPVNHELALNWLRRGYNCLTAEELSDAILVTTGQRLMPGALKKRRERLGLTTKRPPGPPPRESQ